jgi:aminoglycoside 6'-N-acetyltransferase I
MYQGRVWELHPMIVRRECRDQGVGRALVNDFEEQVRSRGGSTIYLGTDDENDRTSLGGVDLYLDPLGAAARIQNLRRHPFEFYRKVGFVIVGVLPDANGFGKPDIFMAKRVQNGA